jgi:Zn-dependent peptidase ImmA (M78 family)
MIKGTKYTIKCVEKIDDSSIAMCDTDKKIIWLTNSRTPKEKRLDLLHEIGHCLFKEIGLDQCISDDVEEIIVENYSSMLSKYIKGFNI